MKFLIFLLALFLVVSCSLANDLLQVDTAEEDPNELKVGVADLSQVELNSEHELAQEGYRIALQALRENENLRKFSAESLKAALPYFERASVKNSSNVLYPLSSILINSLIAKNDNEKQALIQQLATLHAAQNKDYEKAITAYYQGYLYELLLEKTHEAQHFWNIALKYPFLELHETFWDISKTPPNYPRHYTMKIDQYKSYLLPLVVYNFLAEKYEGELSPGTVPVFSQDEIRILETPQYASEVAEGFNITMGRKNIEEAGKFLKKSEFVWLQNFFSSSEVNLLTDFYQGNVVNGTWDSSYDPYLMRTNVYNDRLGFYINKQKEKLLNQLHPNRKVKMAYSFLCHYEDFGGREKANFGKPNLKAHTDRKDNEITVSVTLGDSPLWPLYVHKKRVPNPGSSWRDPPPVEESIEIRVRTGDALIFYGRAHTHWRNPMPDDVKKYSSILYHYVDWDFDYIKYKKYGENGDY